MGFSRGPRSQDLPGALQHDAGGEVAVGSLLPLARQPVVTEVQDTAEVEGLCRRVWGGTAEKEPEQVPVPSGEEGDPCWQQTYSPL